MWFSFFAPSLKETPNRVLLFHSNVFVVILQHTQLSIRHALYTPICQALSQLVSSIQHVFFLSAQQSPATFIFYLNSLPRTELSICGNTRVLKCILIHSGITWSYIISYFSVFPGLSAYCLVYSWLLTPKCVLTIAVKGCCNSSYTLKTITAPVPRT